MKAICLFTTSKNKNTYEQVISNEYHFSGHLEEKHKPTASLLLEGLLFKNRCLQSTRSTDQYELNYKSTKIVFLFSYDVKK